MHDVNMYNDWPLFAHPNRLVAGAFNAVLEVGLTLFVEALLGEVGVII